MKVTEEMMETARSAMECDPAECDGCLSAALSDVLAELTAEELMDMLHDHGVPAGDYENYLAARRAEDYRKDAGL